MAAFPFIHAVDIHKHYETDAGLVVPALKGVSIRIEAGEFVAVMGPSGSGKSTFMNILGCLDMPTRGHYYLTGKDTATLNVDELAGLRNDLIGFVFQGFNLLPRISALENVALPLVYAGVGPSARRQRAAQFIDDVGLTAFAHHLPNQLSGGQQQRVAIARALVNRPRLILADEPTGNLDTRTGREIMEVFARLNETQDITILLVTHEPDIARFARRLVRFIDGRIVQDGAVEEVLRGVAS